MLSAYKTGFPVDPAEEFALQLSNEDFSRPFALGAFNHARVGLQVAIQPDGILNLGLVRLIIGLCSGDVINGVFGARSVSDFNCRNFLGANFAGVYAGSQLSYNAGSGGNNYFSGQGPVVFAKAGTNTDGEGNVTENITSVATSPGLNFATTSGNPRRTPLYIDFIRGVPAWTVNLYGVSSGATLNPSLAQFIDGMSQAGTPVLNGTAMSSRSASIAFSEGSSPLNAINIFWNKGFLLDIYRMRIHRFS
jgi:hypothetical protein